jgi:hypothetical protein
MLGGSKGRRKGLLLGAGNVSRGWIEKEGRLVNEERGCVKGITAAREVTKATKSKVKSGKIKSREGGEL